MQATVFVSAIKIVGDNSAGGRFTQPYIVHA